MCFVWIWEQTTIISLYSINWLVFQRNSCKCVDVKHWIKHVLKSTVFLCTVNFVSIRYEPKGLWLILISQYLVLTSKKPVNWWNCVRRDHCVVLNVGAECHSKCKRNVYSACKLDGISWEFEPILALRWTYIRHWDGDTFITEMEIRLSLRCRYACDWDGDTFVTEMDIHLSLRWRYIYHWDGDAFVTEMEIHLPLRWKYFLT